MKRVNVASIHIRFFNADGQLLRTTENALEIFERDIESKARELALQHTLVVEVEGS